MSTSSGTNLMGAGFGEGDAWDDTELIRAYDKAVKSWRRTQANKEGNGVEDTPGPGPWQSVADANSVSDDKQLAVPIAALPVPPEKLRASPALLDVGSWIVGSPCRALYSEDGEEYEAKIVGIEGPCCIVRFIGYGNEERKTLAELKTTHGKKSRDQQRRSALIYHQNLSNGGTVDIDRISNISLTSSMCNNYSESICRDRDLEETLVDASALNVPLLASTPRVGASKLSNKLKIPTKGSTGKSSSFISQSEAIDNVDSSAIPSGAEATIDSSSDIDSEAAEEGPPEAATSMTNGDWENFNNTMPQFKFPVPPMPLSLSKRDGKFDFGRGELPALLMSWYMAGYQSGYYDAKRELSTSSRNTSRVPKSSKRPN